MGTHYKVIDNNCPFPTPRFDVWKYHKGEVTSGGPHIATFHDQDAANEYADFKNKLEGLDKDLFGKPVKHDLFKAVTAKEDDGWMMMYCSGRSIADNQEWVVTTNGLKSDEIPALCTDAKTFSELVVNLLNQYYNRK